MKTLIVYSSKYGTTETCARDISNSIKSDIISLDKKSSVDMAGYDHIIIGTSVYMGRLRKPVEEFIENYSNTLKDKRITCFFCCNETTDYKSLVPDTISHAETIHFGYELKMSQMKFMDKFITKRIAKASEDVSNLNNHEIKKFIESIKEVPLI